MPMMIEDEDSVYAAFWDDRDWRDGAPIEAGSELDALRQQFPQAWKRFLAAVANEDHEERSYYDDGPSRFEDTPRYRADMIDAGRGRLLR